MLVKKNSRDNSKQTNELLQVENTILYKSMPSYFEHQSELFVRRTCNKQSFSV
jgi:hypothetical protein